MVRRGGGSPGIRTVRTLDELPKELFPEITFAGRSNVGKSSLINVVLGRALAPISRTPGKTRSLRFYESVLAGRRINLVDLPGYGWARLPDEFRERWKALVEGYLIQRAALKGVVLVTDLRRGHNVLDEQMAHWLRTMEMPYAVVATKVDKVPRGRRRALLGPLARGTGVETADVVEFSAKRGEGKRRVIKVLLDMMEMR